MQSKDAIDGVQFGGLDELGMCDSDGEQGTVDRFFPEREEILQRREIREQIVILPDVGLQQQ